MRVWLRLVLLGSIAMALYPLRADADPPAVSADVKAKASEYAMQGLAAQDAGNYDVAIDLYTKAYQLAPHPVMLFNMAQAHRLAGRIDQALALYQKYLDEDPRGGQASTARELIAELKARKAEETRKAEDARRAEEARKAEEVRKAEEARKADELRKAEPAPAVVTTAAPTGAPGASEVPSHGQTLRVAGVVTMSASVVSFVVAIGYSLHGSNLSDELSQPDAMFTRAKEREGERANGIAIAGTITGGVLLGLGVTLYAVGRVRDRRDPGLTVAPLVSDQLTGLVVSGSLR